jgi:DNA mismatch repair protein MutH
VKLVKRVAEQVKKSVTMNVEERDDIVGRRSSPVNNRDFTACQLWFVEESEDCVEESEDWDELERLAAITAARSCVPSL